MGLSANQGPASEPAVIPLGESWQKILSIHPRFRLQPSCGKKGRSEVNQGDGLADDLPRLNAAWPACGKENSGSKVIAIGLAAWKPGCSMVPGNHQQGIIQFAKALQLADNFLAAPVEGHAFPKIIRKVFPDLGDVGQEGRHEFGERVRIQAPEPFP